MQITDRQKESQFESGDALDYIMFFIIMYT